MSFLKLHERCSCSGSLNEHMNCHICGVEGICSRTKNALTRKHVYALSIPMQLTGLGSIFPVEKLNGHKIEAKTDLTIQTGCIGQFELQLPRRLQLPHFGAAPLGLGL